MGTSCANNKCYQGSGPILCPRLLAPGLGTPPPWATPPSSTCGDVPPVQGWQAHARADGTDGLHQPSFPEPRLSPPRRVRTAPQEPYQRGRGMRTPGPPLPPSSGRGCAAEGGCPRPRPIPTYRATGGTSTSRWKLRRREQARGPSNALQSLQMTTPFTFEDSRQDETHTAFFPFMSLVAARRTPLRMRRHPL